MFLLNKKEQSKNSEVTDDLGVFIFQTKNYLRFSN